MTALLLKADNEKRSPQSRRLSEAKEAAARVRRDLQSGKITAEEATAKLKLLARRDRNFINRLLDL